MVTESKSLRTLQKAKTRGRILDTARSLYSKRGILSVRSAEVAQAAGIAHGTLFLHFPTQDELIVAVIEDFGENLCRRLHERSAQGAGLDALLEVHLEALSENEDFYARLATEAPLLPEPARTALVMIQSTASFHLTRAAWAGMDAGSIKRQPLHLLFNTWIGLVHYYLANRELFAPEGHVLERYGKELVQHYMRLVSIETEREGGSS